MLTVVQFTNTFAPMIGGIEKAVQRLHDDLSASGHFNRVVAPAFRGADECEGGILRVPAIKGLTEKRFSLRIPSIRQVDHWMEAVQPDLLHAHQPFMLGDTAWRVSQQRNCPLVFTHHTLYERYSDWPLIDREHAAKLMLKITTQYANRCNVCVAPTESIKATMVDRGITTPIEVAPSGIDLGPYRQTRPQRFRERFGLPTDALVAGHLGRISRAKNIHFLAEAVATLLTENPAAWFLIVGEGEALAEALGTLRSAGVGDRVVSTGNLGGQDVADAHSAMDVFLFASHTDTQGLVLAEAMAAGSAVVALDAPGARDCLDETCSVLLPSNARPVDMASATGELFADSARLSALQAAAPGRAETFEHTRCSRRMVGIYEAAVAAFNPEPPEADSAWEQFLEGTEREFDLLLEKVNAARETFWG